MRHPQRRPDAKDGRTTLNGTKSRHSQLYHAGALTLTPRYKTCAFNTFVARCNESREERANEAPAKAAKPPLNYSTVTLFAKLRGLSTSVPFTSATW